MITENKQASFIKNKGKISLTYKGAEDFGKFLNSCRLKAYNKALSKYSINKDIVHDIGCSIGSWGDNWKKLGFSKSIGFDPNEAVIDQAKKELTEAHHATGDNLPIPDNSVNFAASNAVVIHILKDSEKIEFLSGISRKLTDDGYLFYSVVDAKNYEPAQGKEFDGPTSSYRYLSTHLDILSKSDLELVGMIGTFIDPYGLSFLKKKWPTKDLRKIPLALFSAEKISDIARLFGKVDNFHEVLLITKKKKQS